MFKLVFSILIIIGLGIIIYYYGAESNNNTTIEKKKEKLEISLDQQFDRMFKDASVWNSYDITPVKKIYEANDLNNINVTL